MEYIKYTGTNGFQTYGFIKDKSHKLDQWRMKFERFGDVKGMRVYSTNIEYEIIVRVGEYLHFDPSAGHAYKFKVTKYNPFFLLILEAIKTWNNNRRSKKYAEYYLNDK